MSSPANETTGTSHPSSVHPVRETSYLSRPEGRIGYDVAGDGALVVLVPGMGDLRAGYRFLAPALRAAGYRVACTDLRGHGDSDSTFASYGDQETAGDVIALITELGGAAVVVGNSMGAGAAVLAAAQQPGLVCALVLTGPFVRNPKTSALQRLLLRVAMAPPWAALSWKSYLPKLYAGRRPADFGEYRNQVVASLRRPGYAKAFSATTRTSHAPAEARLADVTAPTLVVMGEQDPTSLTRAALDPRRAGLPDNGRLRRVPGLRREELSQLANVSVDYVVRLEQGRTRRVSRPVLDALADALQLTPDERAHLTTLAEVASVPRTRRPAKPDITPQLQQLLDDMHPIPAMIVYRRMHVLAWNRGAAALLIDFAALSPPDRNLVRLMFLDDAFRSLYADWPRAARDCVAVLRMEADRHPGDPDLIALVGELSIRDPDFRTWWTSHPVHGLGPVPRTFHHPVPGTLTLDVHQLSVGTHPDLLLTAYTAPRGSASREALHILLQPSAQPTDPEEGDATNQSGHHQTVRSP